MSSFRFPPKPAAKKSLFERQRAEAEAKRQREAAETAAVYEEFVKSFDDGGGASGGAGGAAGGTDNSKAAAIPTRPPPLQPPMGGATVGSAGGRRHFTMRDSGSALKKRPFPFDRPTNQRGRDQGARPGGAAAARLAFGDDDDDDEDDGDEKEGEVKAKKEKNDWDVAVGDEGDVAIAAATASSSAADRAEERASAKPTIRLANLPPGTSPAVIRALVASGSSRLNVDSVRMLPTATTTPSLERKAAAALVLLATQTAASDIDAAVSALQNRYLGYGYYLSLHRHLSSAVVGSSTTTAVTSSSSSSSASRPFGARPVPLDKTGAGGGGGRGFAPPPPLAGPGAGFGYGRGRGRGVPPPPSLLNALSSPGPGEGGGPILYVPVRPPRNIRQLRMIHKTVECVLAHGPEFEALLMSRPAVQTEEKWAWIWDARSEGGVWYRYRLWETITGGGSRYVPLFEGSSAWKVPDRHALPYEFATQVSEFVSDSEYDSSDAFDSDTDERREKDRARDRDRDRGDTNEEDRFLSPMDKARLTHLLARLPTSLAKARKGDIARVTAFALTHASRGADEVVDMIVANVERPYAYTAANRAHRRPDVHKTDGGDTEADAPIDTSGAKLIAVYVVSDILASSATSGVRHAWRYRQLFEAALRRRRVFAGLGRLAEQLRWGRLRADKWQRSVKLVLDYWDGWSVFPAAMHDELVQSFTHPPPLPGASSTAAENSMVGGSALVEEEAGDASKTKKGRWKTVDTTTEAATATARTFVPDDGATAATSSSSSAPVGAVAVPDVAGAAERDDGDDNDDDWAYRSEYTDNEALDLACLDEEDLDGAPMDVGGEGVAPYQAYLDGVPLTDEEMAALGLGGGGNVAVAELSEEGEIGSDDDAYAASELSSGNSRRSRTRSRAGDSSDVDMADSGEEKGVRTMQWERQDSGAQDGGREDKLSKAIEAQAYDAATTGHPRAKRMRAADLFVDEDADGQ